MSELTHVDAAGRPGMVDVSGKDVTLRTAIAETIVVLPPEVAAALDSGELDGRKGPVAHTAIIAGTMAARRTHDLIPFCHPLAIEKCKVSIDRPESGRLIIRCEVACHHRTGVEMEALTGASVAALTVYDMCKALSHDIEIASTRLVHKAGGKRRIDR